MTSPTDSPRTDVLAKDERHHKVAETRYWCDQYKTLARELEREVSALSAQLHELQGTPASRFRWLYSELQKHFPNPQPFSSGFNYEQYAMEQVSVLSERCRELENRVTEEVTLVFAERGRAEQAEERVKALREALDKIERETIDLDIQAIARAALPERTGSK